MESECLGFLPLVFSSFILSCISSSWHKLELSGKRVFSWENASITLDGCKSAWQVSDWWWCGGTQSALGSATPGSWSWVCKKAKWMSREEQVSKQHPSMVPASVPASRFWFSVLPAFIRLPLMRDCYLKAKLTPSSPGSYWFWLTRTHFIHKSLASIAHSFYCLDCCLMISCEDMFYLWFSVEFNDRK